MLASGCAELRANIEAEPAPRHAAVLPWALTECQFAVAILPIDAADIGARVPEGFRVLPLREIPGFPVPQDARGSGNLGVEMFRCASGVGANDSANLSDVSYGSVFSFVEPPAELRDENVTYHFLKWDVLIPDAERRDRLRAEGVPAVPGNATFSQFQDVGPLKLLEGLLQMGNDTYELSGGGQPQGTDALAEISFLEFSEARGDAFVEWRTNMSSSQVVGGAGRIVLSGGSWVREVVGSDQAQAYYLAGTGSLANGTIALPWRE